LSKTRSITSAQSFARAVSVNDLNYVLLKRKNGKEIPALHPRGQFTIFAMLDKFLGGNGLASEKSEFWEEHGEAIPITDDQKFAEMLASVQQMPENRREKWTIIVFFAELFNSGRGQIISARTCYDMNLTPKLSRQIKLLIFTADGSPDAIYWKQQVSNAITCVCDSTKGCFFVLGETRFASEQLQVTPFIFSELFCILTVYYGDIHNELTDVGCCCC
jgi:hypothetical protein